MGLYYTLYLNKAQDKKLTKYIEKKGIESARVSVMKKLIVEGIERHESEVAIADVDLADLLGHRPSTDG